MQHLKPILRLRKFYLPIQKFFSLTICFDIKLFPQIWSQQQTISNGTKVLRSPRNSRCRIYPLASSFLLVKLYSALAVTFLKFVLRFELFRCDHYATRCNLILVYSMNFCSWITTRQFPCTVYSKMSVSLGNKNDNGSTKRNNCVFREKRWPAKRSTPYLISGVTANLNIHIIKKWNIKRIWRNTIVL